MNRSVRITENRTGEIVTRDTDRIILVSLRHLAHRANGRPR